VKPEVIQNKRQGRWCAQGVDLRTFLAEFASILPAAKITTQIEALIDRDL
jgi:hypothetical protein